MQHIVEQDATSLYERIAVEIAERIRSGVVQPGERLPSVRKLSIQKRVSISTVLQAYLKLEDMGLVEARPQSGYYVRHHIRSLPPEPAINRTSWQPSQVSVISAVQDLIKAFQDTSIIPLGAASPDPAILPTTRLYKKLASIVRNAPLSTNTYEFTTGNPELRRQIALHSADWQGKLTAEDIIITAGGTESLNLSLRAVARPGDTIAVESPSYFGVLQIIEGLGMKALHIPTDPRDGICLEGFEKACRDFPIRACLVMPNVHNPLGSIMPDSAKQHLVSIAERYGVPLIEDDIYGDLCFSSERPRTLKTFDTTGNVLLCSSFSKTISPAFRIGWTAPGIWYEKVVRLKMTTTLASPTLLQLAIASFLRDGGYDHHLRSMRKAYSQQIDRYSQAIAEFFPDGTKVTRPEGGFVLWVQLPEKVDALLLQRQALERHISIAPGPIFSARNDYTSCVRINCGYTWSATLENALRTIGSLASAMAS